MRYLAAIWVLLTSISTLACECPEKLNSPEKANLVFVGTVIQVNTNWISGGWKFTFQIEESWKRQTDRILIINTAWEKDCGYVFEEGRDYLVYVYKGFTMKTSSCMGNKPLEEAEQAISDLGMSFKPQPSSQLPLMMSLLSLLGFIAIGFIALLLYRAQRKK